MLRLTPMQDKDYDMPQSEVSFSNGKKNLCCEGIRAFTNISRQKRVISKGRASYNILIKMVKNIQTTRPVRD